MQRPIESRFLCFLEKELSLPTAAIALAIDHHHEDLSSEDLSRVPITLWKHELVTINQVGSIQVGSMFDWLTNVHSPLVKPQVQPRPPLQTLQKVSP